MRAVEAERNGFDAYAMATIPNPLIREIRTIVDIPVVGYGEASYHVASMLGRRFGVLVFIDRMAPFLEDQIASHGLSGRCVGVRPSGVTFQQVLAGYTTPGPVIERFQESARNVVLFLTGKHVNTPRLNVRPARSEPRYVENVRDRLFRHRTTRERATRETLPDDAIDSVATKIVVAI